MNQKDGKIVAMVGQEECAKLEALSFELAARSAIIKEMLAMNMDTATEAFRTYHRELVQIQAEFDTAKTVFWNLHKDEFPEGAKNWSLDYGSRQLTVDWHKQREESEHENQNHPR